MNGAVVQGTNGGLAILTAINEVMKDSHGVDKLGAMSLDGSSSMPFMKIDDIVMAYRPLLIAHGIQTIPRLASIHIERDHAQDEWTAGDPKNGIPSRQVQNGKVKKLRVHVFVEVETVFVCLEDGSAIVVRTPGEAMDTQDKATRKAMTSAKKIAFIDTFQIISGDPEEDDDVNGRIEKRDADEDRPNRGEQKVARALDGHGVSPARPASERPQDERPPVASDEADSEDRGKALIRDYVAKHKVKIGNVREFGEHFTGKPMSQWIAKVTQVKSILAAAGEDAAALKKFIEEGEG